MSTLLVDSSSDEESSSPSLGHTTTTTHAPIFVSATRQHVGKTSASLALLSGLQRRFDKIGFLKPVGQESLLVRDEDTDNEIKVDKDAALVKQYFQLDHLSYHHTSPVLIPPGYTKDYIDGKIPLHQQRELVQQAYSEISASSNIVLAEGTGHCAVGSIVEASNAEVASWMNAKMVLVVNGGLGRAYDELHLNKTLCDEHGVEIAGVVINKVKHEKYEQTKEYMTRVLQERWNVPLLGCIPDRPFLGCPALADLERLFEGSCLVSGQEHRLRHYRVQDLNLVATSLEVFLKNLRKDPQRTLYVCHASRNDILLGFLMESQQRGPEWEASIMVTGCADHPISTQVLEIITSMPNTPPVLLTLGPTHSAMNAMHHYTPKLNNEDGHRVEKAVQHYEPYIDFDLLLERVVVGENLQQEAL